MNTDAKVDQIRRLFYVLLRYDMDLDQAGFAIATRTAPSQVSSYNAGVRTVPEVVLDRAVEARRFPRSLVQPALRAIRSNRAAARGWSNVDRALSEMFFAVMLAWSGEAVETIFAAAAPTLPTPPQWTDRPEAASLWKRLEPRNARQRLAMVEEIEDFQSRELSQLVAAKSRDAAPGNPALAQELAALALRIAELCERGEAALSSPGTTAPGPAGPAVRARRAAAAS